MNWTLLSWPGFTLLGLHKLYLFATETVFSTQVPRLYFTWAKQSVFYPQLKMYNLPSCPPSILPAYKLYYTPTKLKIDRCTRNGIITLPSYSGCNNCNLITFLQDIFLVVQAVLNPSIWDATTRATLAVVNQNIQVMLYQFIWATYYPVLRILYSPAAQFVLLTTTQCSIVIKTCYTQFS